MKKHNGLTMVEILFSVLLIGLIAMFLVPSMVSQYAMLVRTKEVTENSFTAMKEVEDQIKEEREIYNGGGNPYSGERLLFSDFNGGYIVDAGGNVVTGDAGKGIKINFSDHDIPTDWGAPIVTYSAKYNPDKLTAPTIKEVKISVLGSSIHNIGYAGDYVQFDGYDYEDPSNDFAGSYKEWHVTNTDKTEGYLPNYGLPYSTTIPNYRNSIPYWKDYKNAVPDTFTNAEYPFGYTANKPGSYVVNSVYAFTAVTKIGNKLPSNSVYISRIPVVNNICRHLDASFIQGDYSTQFADDTHAAWLLDNTLPDSTNGDGDNYVGVVGSWDTIKGPKAVQADAARQPRVYLSQLEIEIEEELFTSVAQYVRFQDDQVMVSNLNGELNSNDFTMFVVARANGDPAMPGTDHPRVLSCVDIDDVGNSWELTMDRFSMNNVDADPVNIFFPAIIQPYEWTLFTVRVVKVTENDTSIRINCNAIEVATEASEIYADFNNLDISIGANAAVGSGIGVDIAEIVIYDNGALDNNHITALNGYFNNKYRLGIDDDDL